MLNAIRNHPANIYKGWSVKESTREFIEWLLFTSWIHDYHIILSKLCKLRKWWWWWWWWWIMMMMMMMMMMIVTTVEYLYLFDIKVFIWYEKLNDSDVIMAQWRLKSPASLLFTQPFVRRSKKPSKLRVTGLCVGNSPAYELLNLRALKFSPVNEIHIFQGMCKIFCVEFQMIHSKFHTKYLTHTIFIRLWYFKNSW